MTENDKFEPRLNINEKQAALEAKVWYMDKSLSYIPVDREASEYLGYTEMFELMSENEIEDIILHSEEVDWQSRPVYFKALSDAFHDDL